MEMIDTRSYVSKESAESVVALIPFKEMLKNLYKLDHTATNEFDKQIFKMVNKSFRKHKAIITKLLIVRSGYMRFK
jgi:hypothetical protein